jgi:pSer/pThr/pTyr-binding forkhead associated (FHA) protein
MDVKLVFFKPSGQRKDFPITKSETLIGRGEDCDLRVPLASVSRRHTRLSLQDDELAVEDLGSSNGTYVNNQRVTEEKLKAGDRLVIGPVVFTVQIDGVPEDVKPIKTRGQLMAEAGDESVEGVVDLEADVIATDEAEALAAAEAGAGEDVDPIAALEQMAAESDKKRKS